MIETIVGILNVPKITIWLPRVTELSREGENTSPEKRTSPSLLPSSRRDHWSRRSCRRAVNWVTSIVSSGSEDIFCGVTRYTSLKCKRDKVVVIVQHTILPGANHHIIKFFPRVVGEKCCAGHPGLQTFGQIIYASHPGKSVPLPVLCISLQCISLSTTAHLYSNAAVK